MEKCNQDTDLKLDVLYPVDPSQAWQRGVDEVTRSLTETFKALLDLNQFDTEVPVRKTYSPEHLEDLLKFELPKTPMPLEQVIHQLTEILKVSPTTSSRRFFNQLFAGRDPASLAGEIFATFGNQSVYTYKIAAPIILIEEQLIQKLGQLAGFSNHEQKCGGIFTPGGSLSNLAAMLCARDHVNPNWREYGQISGRIYTSSDAHYSVNKGAGLIGVGRQNVVKVASDAQGRMNPEALLGSIQRDLDQNMRPMMVIATAGTTVRGCFDPFEEIATICKDYGIWFHVDGAFGGTALLHPQFTSLVQGIEKADSLTWDAHKAMGVPLTCSVLLTKDRTVCERAFNEEASYLFQADTNLLNPGTRSLQCGRRNDALKLWASWLYHGDHGWIRRLERQRNLALALAEEVESRITFKLCEPPPYLNVCFEVVPNHDQAPIDHEELCYQLQIEQKSLVGFADFKGRNVIRAAVINPELTLDDLHILLDDIEALCFE
jgi:glutamate/tyrosine decarboxylase-like PLP-dependent enzyme